MEGEGTNRLSEGLSGSGQKHLTTSVKAIGSGHRKQLWLSKVGWDTERLV
ncbi:hypothetical protein [Sporisorium scitamineum]|uniref:Uncharacterized protein n=1 Tax=Sporisorium scitamineum TaxID=49012 RepID=A0A0F7RVV8_9BASI|nr:hypothetical protein [Sporisorium scitamineum]